MAWKPEKGYRPPQRDLSVKIQMLNRLLDNARISRDNEKLKTAEAKRKLKESENRYNEFLSNYRAVDRFFTKAFYWRPGGGMNIMAVEIVERIITGYDKLIAEHKLTSFEVTFFSTGYNQETFTAKDIRIKRDRTESYIRKFNTALDKMISDGYLSSFKDGSNRRYGNPIYYYLTPKGRERWEKIIKVIFLTQIKRPWTDIMQTVVPFEEKRTVRIYRKGKLK